MAEVGVMIGSGLGSLVGGFIGNKLGKYIANEEIEKKPVEKIELSWMEPKTNDIEIGKIPINHSLPRYTTTQMLEFKPVIVKKPILDETGDVSFKKTVETFSGHGKPEVKWIDKEILEPQKILAINATMAGYYYYDYEPVIDNKVIGFYKAPDVLFNHGVNINKITTSSTIIGASFGALFGGIFGNLLPF